MNMIPYSYYIATFLLIAASLQGAEQGLLTYEKAEQNDIHALDSLMLTEGVKDSNKIVILPNKFRKGSIESAIAKGRFFVVRHQDSLIGYKKLFLMDDKEECTAILTGEIRCIDNPFPLVDHHSFVHTADNEYTRQPINTALPSLSETTLYIYDGADFTKETFRGRGINQALTAYAFSSLKEEIRTRIKETRAKRLALVYGLTHFNDYDKEGKGKSRTPHIVHSFASLIHVLTGLYPNEIHHRRYTSFMPTFDLEAEECRPNPDNLSVPGYGNVIEVTLPASFLEKLS